MDERRELPRWEIKKEAKVWMPLIQGFSHCMVEDLHLKGMCLSFNRCLPIDRPVKLSFSLENDFDFIKVEAQVSWMKESKDQFTYGLLFSKIDDPDKDKVSNYIITKCYDQFKDNGKIVILIIH